jgi:hypothetical protein
LLEQRDIGVRADRQVQIRQRGGGGFAWVDDDDFSTAQRAIGLCALEQYRVAPGGIGADENQQIRLIDVIVAAWHDVLAKSADMAGDGRGHAQSRVGIDICGTNKTFHQFVGDVVVFAQELAGAVDGDGIRAVFGNGGDEFFRNQIERFIPVGFTATDGGMCQAIGVIEGLRESRPLDAKPAFIGGMVDVAGDSPAFDGDAATHPAIRAGGIQAGWFAASRTRPFSTFTA